MLNSFTKKFKTFIFNTDDKKEELVYDRKRKRPFVDTDRDGEETYDAQFSMKKPKLQEDRSVFKSILSSSVVQNMSDWVQQKTNKLFVFGADANSDELNTFQPPANLKTNGDTHHRFKTADVSNSYMTGNWPQNGGYEQQSLTRPPLHGAVSKPMAVSSNRANKGTEGRGPRKKPTHFSKMFKIRNMHKFTAGESVRLEDKVRYQQLLQQFTTVPLDQPETCQPTPDTIKNPISVAKLPRFYFSSNKSILGSQISQDVIPQPQRQQRKPDQDRLQTIKVHPNHRSTPQAVRNGRASDDRSLIHITDISAIRHTTVRDMTRHDTSLQQRRQETALPRTTVVDLTDDEPILVVETKGESLHRTQSPASSKSISKDFRQSKFVTDDWIKDLTSTYSSQRRERDRKIKEEEMRAKLFDERRKTQDQDLEQRIRKQMQIHAREPAVIEEIEVSSEEEEEEEKEEEFIELTQQMENKIHQCLHGGNDNEVLVDKFRLQITRRDIKTLSKLTWLNDEVINFYMNLLMERSQKTGAPKVHAFNTFFYPKILNDGQSAVKRWTRRVDIFAVDYILVPVHLGMHWCLAVVNFKKKDIQYYDSMGGNNMQCLNALKKYLCDESMEKKKKEFDLSGWKTTIVKEIPQQMNGSDCGMFTCKYAEYITRESPMTFTQEHMPYFRRRMVYEIATGQLLQ